MKSKHRVKINATSKIWHEFKKNLSLLCLCLKLRS